MKKKKINNIEAFDVFERKCSNRGLVGTVCGAGLTSLSDLRKTIVSNKEPSATYMT